MAKNGRPSIYSDSLAEIICERLARGESLNKICSDADMPSRDSVMRWVESNPEFCNRYARARERQAEYFLDLIVDETGEIDTTTNSTVQAAKLRIDTLKWAVCKLFPRKYGDKLAIGGADDLPPVKTESTLNPGEAYLKMLGGGS